MRKRLAWVGEQLGWFVGIVGCLFLMLVLLPLVPLFEFYDDVRKTYENR
jgi:lipoprotein